MRFAFLPCLVAAAALAQGQAPAVSEKVEVILIEVPVHVVDRQGNAVKGLTADRFEIFDEGKKKEVTHFEEIDLTAPVSNRERFTYSPAARRNFLLLFDLSYSSPGSIERAARAAREFVQRGMSDRDLAGIATFSVERGFDWISSFTTDRKTLLTAIEAVGSSKMVGAADPLALSVTVQSATGGATADRAHQTREAFDETAVEIARRNTQTNEEIQRARIRHQLDHFGRLARILDRVRGQKQVILLSEGFDARLLQGAEASAKVDDSSDFAASVHGEIWRIDNDTRFGNTAAVSVLDQMAGLFRRSDVVLHSFDIKGLRSDVDARVGYKAPSNESLFLLSKPTGGQIFKNANDVSENFSRMLRQQQVVYVLGFPVSSPGTPGKFHNLKVRVRDVAGARIFHRAGYYEPSIESSALEKTLTAVEILMNDIPQDDIEVSMMAAPFKAEIGNPQVPVIVEIAGPTLLQGVTGNSVDAEVFIYAFDRDYAVRDFVYQKTGLDLTKLRAKLSSTGMKFYGALNLPAGDYEVKALVRVAQTGRRGYERLVVKVPDFSTISLLQPFMIGEEGEWVMVKNPPRRPAEVDYPFTISSEPFVPRVSGSLRADGSYEVALFGYNLDPDGLELSARIRDAAGAERPANITLLGRTPSGAAGPTKLLFNFKPAGLSTGKYALDFTLKPRNASQPHNLSMPFIVN